MLDGRGYGTVPSAMRAAVYRSFGGPITVEEIPVPSITENGDDAVLIQVLATGVCRSDWHGWKGHDSDIRDHGLKPYFVPGHEVSGRVVQVGRNVRLFSPGDRVAVPFILSCGRCRYCGSSTGTPRPTICTNQQQPGFTQHGSYAEYLVLPRADRNLKKLPANVSFVQAAALGCRFTTAYRAIVQQGQLLRSQTVAIWGVGGLGLSCVMIAAATGASRILAVDVNAAALDKAKSMGATHTVQVPLLPRGEKMTDEMTDQLRAKILSVTVDGEGADLSVEASGFALACETAIWCTRRGGRMVQVGLIADDDDEGRPRIPMGLIAARELELVGSHGFASDDLPNLLNMVATRQLDPSQLVEQQVSLEEGVRVLQDMDHKSPLGITMITNFKRESRL